MANFREYSAKLSAMSGMRRVTATMKMVAASHLHRAQSELKLPEPFAQQLLLLSRIARLPCLAGHRLVAQPEADGRPALKNPAALLVINTSDRGLCGAFNSSIAREVRAWFEGEKKERGMAGEALFVGQKGRAALRHEIASCGYEVPAVSPHPRIQETLPIAAWILDAFLARRYDEVWLVGNRFVSTMTHKVKIKRILPYDPTRVKLPAAAGVTPLPELLEPLDSRLIETLVRLWVHDAVFYAQLNRTASEQASRVMAMENATVNLRRMEKELILLRNRARQAAITNELTEIVSGAESLA
jgi:F-type H+-transporting ATPase subunit gamma